jgi:hypothetical protein
MYMITIISTLIYVFSDCNCLFKFYMYDIPQEFMCGIAQQVYGWVCYNFEYQKQEKF